MTEFQKEIESILSVLEDREFNNVSLMLESLMYRAVNLTTFSVLQDIKTFVDAEDYQNSFLKLEELLNEGNSHLS